ncbi:Ig-like domain repeat protein [Edaphobacter sp. HDX4]|uniref:NHL domain-containing protein n=1 Tax=Edaphobacter sp. HDX4 TaxID=2794064 RepID=UPI002FE6060E
MSSASFIRRGFARRSLLLVLSALAIFSGQAFAASASGPVVQFAATINRFAGNGTSGDSGDEGAATSAQFIYPVRPAIDAAGNIYVPDLFGNRVRKIDTSGKITTFAGNGTAGYSGDNGHATTAQIDTPEAVAVDAAGNVYISDFGNQRIRKVDTNGMITTFAGTGTAGFSGDGGLATAAMLKSPFGLAVDASGNVYFADNGNQRVRKIGTDGKITTVAGTGTTAYNNDGIAATSANIWGPVAIALDASGNLYIGDNGNHRIRKVFASTGYIKTVVGDGTTGSGSAGDNGSALDAQVGSITDIKFDASGNMYVSDSTLQRVRKIGTGGVITAFAGNGTAGSSGDGGLALAASLNSPAGLAIDSKGVIYVADESNHVVRAISGHPTVATLAATPVGQGITADVAVVVNRDMVFKSVGLASNNGSAQTLDFKIIPTGGCLTDGFSGVTAGTVCMFSVTFNPNSPGHRTAPLAFVDTNNTQYTLALAGEATGAQIAYSPTYPNPANLTLSSGLNHPTALAFDNYGNGYIADQGRIQEAVNLNALTTLSTGSIPTEAPTGLATDAQGNLYIVDAYDSYVVKVTPSHRDLISGVAYSGTASQIQVPLGDGLSGASGIAATDRGDLYVADKGNSRIVKITAAGSASALNTGSITLDSPEGVAVDSKGNVFIADTDHVVKVAVDGTASVMSTGGLTLGHAKGVAVDPVGNLYIADSTNKKILRITTDGTVSLVQTTDFSIDPVSGISIVNNSGNVDSIATNGLYLATSDSDANKVTVAVVSGAALTFSQTAVGHDSSDGAKTVAVQNVGNASVTFLTPSTGSNPSYPDGFPGDDNASQLCTGGTTLNTGSSCNVAVKFHPTQAGMQQGYIMLATDISGAAGSEAFPQAILVMGNALPGMDHFLVTGAPVNSDAGTPFNVTVTAADSSNEAFTSYTGTVHLKSSDAVAGLPEDYTFTTADNGVHTFPVTLKTAGSQIITVYDTANIEVMGQATVQVNAGTPTSITVVSGDGQSVVIGGYFQQELEAKVLDQYSNPVPNATVNFTVPPSGAGVTASSGTRTTESDGTAYFFSAANGIAGSYQIVASVQGVDTPAIFHLTNTAGTTTTALTATPSSSATYGQAVTLSATVTPNATYRPAIVRSPAQPRAPITASIGPATGSVSFYDGTKLVGTAALGGDPIVVGSSRSGLQAHYSEQSAGVAATATLNIAAPLAGDHSYTAVYAGDSNFTTSQTTAPVALTVGQAAATLTGPATQPVSVGSGQTGTITVNVAAQSGATGLAVPTGTISYQVGSGNPQQAALSNGQATLQVPSTLAIGSYSVQATYSGDSNYQPTTTATTIQISVVNTVPADFSLTANPSTLTVKAGDTGTATFTFTPVGGFTGTVTFGCGSLPVGVTCTFAPATLTADGSNKVQTSQLTITTQRLVSANFFLPGALLGGLLFWQRRRFNLRKAHVLMVVLAAGAMIGMVGCGSSGPQTNATAAKVTVTAQATGGNGGSLSHTASFTLNVTN